MDTFGSRLIKLRGKLTQTKIGKIAGDVGKATVSNWEQDKTTPNAIAALLIARHFNVSPYYLMFGEDNPKQLDQRLQKFVLFFEKINKLHIDGDITDDNLNHIEIVLDNAISGLEHQIPIWIEENDPWEKQLDDAFKTCSKPKTKDQKSA